LAAVVVRGGACDPRRRRRDRAGLAPASRSWPNDLFADGAKFAGILIEGQGGGDAGNAVVVGIGVNCATHPTDADYPATDLAEASLSPEEVFGALSAKMLARLAQWNSGEGFSTIRAEWLARAAGLGEDVRVSRSRDHGPVRGARRGGRGSGLQPDGAVTTVAVVDVPAFPAAPAEMTR
jgi:BirA family biotin operon repressor/biotin-[acetyl-CoA-carboxylase] ligase